MITVKRFTTGLTY